MSNCALQRSFYSTTNPTCIPAMFCISLSGRMSVFQMYQPYSCMMSLLTNKCKGDRAPFGQLHVSVAILHITWQASANEYVQICLPDLFIVPQLMRRLLSAINMESSKTVKFRNTLDFGVRKRRKNKKGAGRPSQKGG